MTALALIDIGRLLHQRARVHINVTAADGTVVADYDATIEMYDHRPEQRNLTAVTDDERDVTIPIHLTDASVARPVPVGGAR